MGMRGTDETRARPWLEVLPVAVEGRLRTPAATVMSTGACRHERAVHTPDPRLCCTAKAVFAVRFVKMMFMLRNSRVE